ncbi:unnamed protein product [Linum tenue]|uniref:Cytochrome P450 n=1 Tax=Linum tenue TaxID=586396 RepID=A0AAV0RLV0_9ROSI|nr:unnamed protein product [Linum tenue]
MDLAPSLNTIAALAFVALALALYHSHRRTTKLPPPPPMAGGRRPIIGHLGLFTAHNSLPHVTLGALADKHGPIFTIQLGIHRAVVVNSWELAKELYSDHDLIISTRPNLTATRLLGYDMVMFGFAPHGGYWREMRKFVILELLSHRKIELLRDVRASEVACLVKFLVSPPKKGEDGAVEIELKRLFGDMTLNVIMRMVVGKRLFGRGGGGVEEEEARRCSEAIRGLFHYLGMFVLRDALPFLGWMDVGGHEKAMKRIAEELDGFLDGWLEEHRRKRGAAGDGGGEGEQDFMGVMLAVLDGAKFEFEGHDPDVINKSACLNLIARGTDTTTVTLTWAISLLLNNNDVLLKAYQELDKQVGTQRPVNESDIPNLTYLQAIVKETLRLYPAAPLSGPREFTSDCVVGGGYHIPKGTQLITNIWKIQTDPRAWTEPLEFRPERFLGRTGGGLGSEYMPFGSGRRSCPGMAFGIHMVNSVLASFLHAFEIRRVGDDAVVDMTESPGLTNMKATPLEVLVSPRLPLEVYGG